MEQKQKGYSWKQTIIMGVFYAVFMFLIMGVFANWDNLTKEILIKEAVKWSIGGVVFAILMYVFSHWYAKYKSKKEA